MESERSNNTPSPISLTDEEDIFDPQYESTPNRSILYYKIQPTAPTNSQGKFAQGKFKTCSLCNEPDPLFEPNRANLEPVVRLSCLHSFHLRCIIISLKKNMTCSRCQRLIYLGEDDDARLNPQEEEDRVKKFFRVIQQITRL